MVNAIFYGTRPRIKNYDRIYVTGVLIINMQRESDKLSYHPHTLSLQKRMFAVSAVIAVIGCFLISKSVVIIIGDNKVIVQCSVLQCHRMLK